MVGQLTTHVLDTAQGSPAVGMVLELWAVDRQSPIKSLLKQTKTNEQGRTLVPLLDNGELEVGTYELVFFVGDYFQRVMGNLAEPVFLDQVPIQFGVSDPHSHYHVPLLVSPWSYTTYRGS